MNLKIMNNRKITIKKENLLLTVIVILVFITGLIVGKSLQNDSGRFLIREYSTNDEINYIAIDTKEGIVYETTSDYILKIDLRTYKVEKIKYP